MPDLGDEAARRHLEEEANDREGIDRRNGCATVLAVLDEDAMRGRSDEGAKLAMMIKVEYEREKEEVESADE